ncbi:phage portal protein [Salipiger marinus]|uniref:phage portal protein n=1 Tax=Salipiger marinus TaxID=555512 RepID=UPI002CFDBB3D|nr:phage portal protein [Salipiger manganoxidans]MEB3417028.1 phage portal protein [Salipiger manganoxidans]
MQTRQVLRAAQRGLAKLFRRSGIEAGSGGRRWEGAALLTAPQTSTLAARGAAQARAGAQYLNNPHGQRIVESWVSAMVGKGWQVRSLHPDKSTARALNEAFEALTQPVLTLAARCLVRDGEAFLRIHITDDGEIRVKPVPAEQVDPSIHRDLGGGARIVAGVEFDAQDEVTAYHILPEAPGTPFVTYGPAVRVPARDVLHVFDRLFPGQVRGLSWLAPVLLKLRDRDEASDALLMLMKTASLMTGYVRDLDGSLAGFDGTTDGYTLNVALEPGAMRILPQGADVTFSNPGQGLTQAVEFLRAQDREIATGVGLTFEALTGDLTQTNYSSARVGLLEFRRRAEMMQRNLIEGAILRPLWRRWIEIRAIAGQLDVPGPDLTDFLAVRFVPPGWQWVDPKNEVEADVRAIDAGLKSRAEVVAGRGRDIDELDDEIARDAGRNQGSAPA